MTRLDHLPPIRSFSLVDAGGPVIIWGGRASSAVWTGSEMIVRGGGRRSDVRPPPHQSTFEYLATGARFRLE